MDYLQEQINQNSEFIKNSDENFRDVLNEQIELFLKIEIENIQNKVISEFINALDLLIENNLIKIDATIREELIQFCTQNFRIEYHRFNNIEEAREIIRKNIDEEEELIDMHLDEICSRIYNSALKENYFNWIALISFPSIDLLKAETKELLKNYNPHIEEIKELLKSTIYSSQTLLKQRDTSYLIKQMINKSFRRVMNKKKKRDMFFMLRLNRRGQHPKNDKGIEYYIHIFLGDLGGSVINF